MCNDRNAERSAAFHAAWGQEEDMVAILQTFPDAANDVVSVEKVFACDRLAGCGYQAAVLAELVDQVYSIEIVPQLAEAARHRLAELGFRNIKVRTGDGYRGWPERA